MATTEILRKKVKEYVDKADEKTLRMIHAIFEIEGAYDLWDDLPEHVKVDVDEAFKQSAKGEGKPHKEVMKKYRQ